MLEARGVYKSFGSVRALDGVSVGVRPGEVRAVLGGNGSGKSTLSKVLTGVVRPDRATFIVDGQEVGIDRPSDALGLGIVATYQELSLLVHLSVGENILINCLPTRGPWVGDGAVECKVGEMLDRLGLGGLASTKVRDLSLAERSLVELAKAMHARPRYLILDELTASLRKGQVELVRRVIGELSADGVGILYVSHRLEEVFDFCESVTVLRNGKVAMTGQLARLDERDLIVAMSGDREGSAANSNGRPAAAGPGAVDRSADGSRTPLLSLNGVALPAFGSTVSLEGYPGEIVGIAGLQGHGQSELLRLLFGAVPGSSVEARLDGRTVEIRTVREAIGHGLGFISGDRENEMAFGQRLVGENLHVVARASKQTLHAEGLLGRLGLPPERLGSPMRTLSGGNQQKVVVGRWLGLFPEVLLADDPTRGVDVRARREIHGLLRELAGRGSLILYSSSDDKELEDLCDRVYVLYRGRVVSELSGGELTEHEIGAASVSPTRRSEDANRN
jgi:ABC-type sugar transport system ATPase subunit